MAPRGLILPPGITDPPSLRGAPAQRPIFDAAPHRNRGMVPCPELPPRLLNQVIAMAVEFGMPRRETEEARTNPYVRTHVALLACMIWDAAGGDRAARQALERIKFAFGNRANIAEMISAHEQPADSGEITKLMGGN